MRNACRPMGRSFCLLVAMAVVLPLLAQAQPTGPAMKQAVNTVYRADGTAAIGTLLISWPAFTTADGKATTAGSMSVKLGSGAAFTASPVAEHRSAAGGGGFEVRSSDGGRQATAALSAGTPC